MNNEKRVLILGIGNILWADEGFGVRAVEAINQTYSFPSNVTVMDGGTQGLYLVQYVQNADILIVFDAIDYGLEPGTMKVIRNDEVPRFMGVKKMSLHQTGFQEVLSSAALLGGYPEELMLIGVQPEELDDYGGSLRPVVRERIQPAIETALAFLAEQGIHAQTLDQAPELPAASAPLAIDVYEQERPSEEDACRYGDARFLAASGAEG